MKKRPDLFTLGAMVVGAALLLGIAYGSVLQWFNREVIADDLPAPTESPAEPPQEIVFENAQFPIIVATPVPVQFFYDEAYRLLYEYAGGGYFLRLADGNLYTAHVMPNSRLEDELRRLEQLRMLHYEVEGTVNTAFSSTYRDLNAPCAMFTATNRE